MVKTLEELAHYLKGEPAGDNVTIHGVAGLSYAREGDITFIDHEKYLETALQTPASAIIIPPRVKECARPFIKVKNPRLAFAQLLSLFHGKGKKREGIDDTAILGRNVELGSGVYIGPFVYIGDNVKVGANVQLFPFVYVEDDVTIGDDTILYPRVSLMKGIVIGKRVTIHSGAVIGADGFGFVRDGTSQIKIPQVGIVIVGDDVEIGANATIDRATTDATRIGRGTKIDNLIQIGHNTQVGEDCIIVSQAGIAGSVTVGDRVTIAAQAGVRDHVQIESDSIVAGRAGVTKNVSSGSLVSGFPARDHKEELKIEAAIAQLPELVKKVKKLEHALLEKGL
ncbi:MAG: UDP-3-O-(3-hydroxymyristoyl)glucosamine N-acyltransferase [Candidatus Eremiobacteraeota bacterium]|nr:UDP-3-O-(3-hydroxymyristoyl)glucosamine N-acyltransferase [Candidatus Eremiobacteraeota bacterium]